MVENHPPGPARTFRPQPRLQTGPTATAKLLCKSETFSYAHETCSYAHEMASYGLDRCSYGPEPPSYTPDSRSYSPDPASSSSDHPSSTLQPSSSIVGTHFEPVGRLLTANYPSLAAKSPRPESVGGEPWEREDDHGRKGGRI